MEIISAAVLAAGVGLLMGGGGYALGRRQGDTRAEQVQAAASREAQARVQRAEQQGRQAAEESAKLRELIGMEAIKRGGLNGSDGMAPLIPGLRDVLAEVQAHRGVETAAVLDLHGLVVAGDEQDDRVRVMAGLFGGIMSGALGSAQPESLALHTDLGQEVRFDRAPLAGQGEVVYVASWSEGLELPRSAQVRMRAMCAGELPTPPRSPQRPSQPDAQTPALLASSLRREPLVMGRWLTAEDDAGWSASPVLASARDVLVHAHRLNGMGKGLGTPEVLVVHHTSGGVSAMHRLLVPRGRVHWAWVTLASSERYDVERHRTTLQGVALRAAAQHTPPPAQASSALSPNASAAQAA